MDYYIAKLNAATGEAVWAKTFGGVRNWEMFNSVVADEAGNLYAVATFGNVSSAPLEMPLKDGSSTSLAVTNNWGEDYLIIRFPRYGQSIRARNGLYLQHFLISSTGKITGPHHRTIGRIEFYQCRLFGLLGIKQIFLFSNIKLSFFLRLIR